MKKISIIYWSGTGNTKRMAEAVNAGAIQGGAAVKLMEAGDASVEDAMASDFLALGCPSMGCEVLEESEMEPFVSALESNGLEGKQLVLFGSYDWGDGQWMRDWKDRMEAAGAVLVERGLIINNTPDEAGLQLCRELGRKLSEA